MTPSTKFYQVAKIIVDVVMWPMFGYFSTFVREVIITQILYGFDQKKRFFWRVVLVQVQWFETGTRYGSETLELCGKMYKTKSQKCWGKLTGNLFCISPSSHPEQSLKQIDTTFPSLH